MIRLTIYSNTVFFLIRSLVYFHFFEALNGAFVVQFFRASFYTLSKTLIACRDTQLRFFKVKTLLNNAFKINIKSTPLNKTVKPSNKTSINVKRDQNYSTSFISRMNVVYAYKLWNETCGIYSIR